MNRIPQLELLRVLCMAAVFFFHLYLIVPGVGKAGLVGQLLSAILNQGYVGVVIFNMITAFVLTLPHAPPNPRPPLAYKDFFRRRFVRICPQYYLCLLLFTVLAFAFSKTPLSEILIAFFQHLFFLHTLDPSRFFAIVPAFWWVALLAQFYLIFPLLLKAFLRFGAASSLAATSIVCYSGWWLLARASSASPDTPLPLLNYMMTFNLPARLPEFALGMFMAFAWKASRADDNAPNPQRSSTGSSRRVLIVLSACALISIAATIALKKAVPVPFGHILVVAACLFGAASLFLTPYAARIGSTQGIVRLAAASYGIYLVHQPILRYVVSLVEGRMPPLATFCLVGVIAGVSAFAMAVGLDRLTTPRQT